MDESSDLSHDVTWVGQDLVFPELKHCPTARLQLAFYGPSSMDVMVQLRTPKRDVTGGLLVTFPATVPEAAVDEMATLLRLFEMSGLPGTCVSWTLYLAPCAHSNLLTTISGIVSLPLILAITLLRVSLVRLSTIFHYSLEALPKDTFEPVNKGIGETEDGSQLDTGSRSSTDDMQPTCTARASQFKKM